MYQPNGLKRTACLKIFVKKFYPPPHKFRTGKSVITNKLSTKKFI